MSDDARLGRLILITITALMLVGEVLAVLITLLLDELDAVDAIRMLLTFVLLWQVWDGARWARWLTAAFFLFVAAFAIGVAVGLPAGGGEAAKKTQTLMVAIAAFYAAIGVAMISPWVAAYQVVQRKRIDGLLKGPYDF